MHVANLCFRFNGKTNEPYVEFNEKDYLNSHKIKTLQIPTCIF